MIMFLGESQAGVDGGEKLLIFLNVLPLFLT